MWDVARRQLREQRRLERALPPVTAAPRDGDCGLSPGQGRLWRLERSGAEIAYNITLPLRLRGELDQEALRRAVRDVMNRHEALRTVFAERDGTLVQRPLEAVAPELPCRRLGLDDTSVRIWLEEQAQYRFDLRSEPPFRMVLGRQGSHGDWILLLLAHHIVLDGRSATVLFREVRQLYAGYAAGRQIDLPAPPLQLRDVVQWQRGWLDGPAAEPFLDYWRAQLPVGRMRELLERPAPGDWSGGRVQVDLPTSLVAAVHGLATRAGSSTAAVHLTTFQELLRRSTGSADVTVGVPAANRGRAELAEVVGFLVNILPVAGRSARIVPGPQAVRDAERVLCDAYAHQAVPIEHVVARLLDQPEPAALPIDAFFVAYRQVLGEDQPLPGLRAGPEPALAAKDAEFPLMLTVVEGQARATAMFSHRICDHDAASARQLAADYLDLLDAATRDRRGLGS
jgi:hypothetical protein